MTTLLSFITPDYSFVYEKYLAKSLFDLRFRPHSWKLYRVDKNCDWTAATNLKPGIILEELKKGHPVLYVDADAMLMDEKVMDVDAIVPPQYVGACVFLDWDKWYGTKTGRIEPLTATLFFRSAAIPLIEAWCDLAKKNLKPDGYSFAEIIKGRTDIFPLPISWCYIEGLPAGGKGGITCENPLIIQYQASRETR